MKDELLVKRYMIMTRNQVTDTLVQYSNAMSLENCRLHIESYRKTFQKEQFSIVAVLDE